jgi:hypothetical protein
VIIEVDIVYSSRGQRLSGLWTPNSAEQRAAWELLVELSTRVPVIPLRREEGVLREVLTSLRDVFLHTRDILRSGGPDVAADVRGQLSFAVIAGHLLNQVVRPVTAYWHPALEAHEATRDEGVGKREHELRWDRIDELREVLAHLRPVLVSFARLFAEACGAQEFLRIQLDNEEEPVERHRLDATPQSG